MAKDPRNIGGDDSRVRRGIKKLQETSDEKIVAQAQDSSSAAIQAANEKRLEGVPTGGTAPKNEGITTEDPLRAKPTVEEITPGQEARAAARNVGTARPAKTTVLDFGKLPSRPEGTSKPAEVNVTEKPDVAINLIDRLKSGMGLPGQESGHLDLAVSLHEKDRQTAVREGKVINGVQPDDPKATHMTVFGGHHHRLAKVMNTFGIADEEVYKNAASAAGVRLESHVHALHKIAQEHEDSKRQVTLNPKEGDMWEHPDTKEVIPIAANHPDMPMAFTRTKGKVARVTRGPQGEEVVSRSHEGWDAVKVRGGQSIYRQYSAPKGIDLVDHMRVQMLSEHGPSATSRKKGASIASEMADVVSGVVPRGMKKAGKRKVAVATTPTVTSRPKAARTKSAGANMTYRLSPTNVEGYEPVFVPKPEKGQRADKGTRPPKAGRGVLVGTVDLDTPVPVPRKRKTPAETRVENLTRKPRYIQDTLPGTGQPKVVAEIVSPAKFARAEGPIEQWGARAIESGKTLKNPITETDVAPKVKVADEVRKTSVVPTEREWKRENPNIGQQFSGIDTTDMTGAQEVKALSQARAFVHQQPSASKELVVRPGGKKQAKRDLKAAKAAPKPQEPEQLSLFPDYSVKEGRSNAFYMAGSVQPLSEATKQLQADAKKNLTKEQGPEMARVANFSSEPEKFDRYKSLRHNAREAAEYLTGLPYQQPKPPVFDVYKKPGRGASGEHQN